MQSLQTSTARPPPARWRVFAESAAPPEAPDAILLGGQSPDAANKRYLQYDSTNIVVSMSKRICPSARGRKITECVRMLEKACRIHNSEGWGNRKAPYGHRRRVKLKLCASILLDLHNGNLERPDGANPIRADFRRTNLKTPRKRIHQTGHTSRNTLVSSSRQAFRPSYAPRDATTGSNPPS